MTCFPLVVTLVLWKDPEKGVKLSIGRYTFILKGYRSSDKFGVLRRGISLLLGVCVFVSTVKNESRWTFVRKLLLFVGR